MISQLGDEDDSRYHLARSNLALQLMSKGDDDEYTCGQRYDIDSKLYTQTTRSDILYINLSL